MRILLVDTTRPLIQALRDTLEEHFTVDTAASAEVAQRKALRIDYSVIVLGPGVDGLGLLQHWRREGLATQVLLLVAAGPSQRVRCLEAGADDCLSCPIEPAELAARLRALVRRRYRVKDPVIRIHDLEVDTLSRAVRRAGQDIHLSPREYALLEFLAFNQGKVTPRTKIRERLYGGWDDRTPNAISVHVACLRNKIDRDFHPPLIVTRWGEGYMLGAG